MKRSHLCVLLTLFVVGCATKSEFLYDHPNITENSPSGLVAACEKLQDKRQKPCKLDKIYYADPIEEIGKIIQQEIVSTGLFVQVIQLSEGDTKVSEGGLHGDADLLVSAKLREMNWIVPNYAAMLGKTFGVSVLTGGIGGLIYGSTETDVYGDAKISIKVVDLQFNRTLLDKDYVGHAEEKMKKLACDTPSAKARMVGEAIKGIMQQFKEDLSRAVQEESRPGLHERTGSNHKPGHKPGRTKSTIRYHRKYALKSP